MATQTQTPSEQQTTAEQEARERLLKLVAAVVGAAVAAEMGRTGVAPYLAAAHVSKEAVIGAITRSLVAGAFIVHRLAHRYARVLLTDNDPSPASETAVQELIAQEKRFEAKYVEKAAARMTKNIAMSLARGESYDTAVEKAVLTEERMFGQRMDAVRQRVYERVEEQRVQADSPDGAYWQLDTSLKTHTADCIAMANRAWSWDVLRLIRPSNRHFGCGCRLIPLWLARAAAMPRSDRVLTSPPEVAISAKVR